MKKQHILISGIGLTAIMALLLMQKNNRTANKNTAGESVNLADGSNTLGYNTLDGATSNGSKVKTTADFNSETNSVSTNNCFRFSYQHQGKNLNRDLEDFLNDTNAFPISHANVNLKSICVKVNDKAVNFKFSKKSSKTEVLIGSVVGPESIINVSYCVGSVVCKEACNIKIKNKVDELISDNEMGVLENAELENRVRELRNVASIHENLMDSTIIRDWNQLQSKEWICKK